MEILDGRGEDAVGERIRQCEGRGRDWSEAATDPGMLSSPQRALVLLDFGFVAFRTVKELISVILS